MIEEYEFRNLHDSHRKLTIKQFSEISEVEESTLRYWDNRQIFSPGIRDETTGYRFYLPEQIVQVNFIKVLSNLNVPLKTIRELSQMRSPEMILELLEAQEIVFNKELMRLHKAYSTIHTLRNVIKQGSEVKRVDQISVQELPLLSISIGVPNEAWEGVNFYQAFSRYCRYAREKRINLNLPIGGYHQSFDKYLQAPSVPTCFFSIDPQGTEERPAGKYLVGYAQGFYGKMGDAPERLRHFAQQQNLSLSGEVYVVYQLNEISNKEPSDYLAEIAIRL